MIALSLCWLLMQPVPTVEFRAEDILNSTAHLKVVTVETSEAPGNFTTVTLTLRNDYPNEITGYVVTHGNDNVRKDLWFGEAGDAFPPGGTDSIRLHLDSRVPNEEPLRISFALLDDGSFDGDESLAGQFQSMRLGAKRQIDRAIPVLDGFLQNAVLASESDIRSSLELLHQRLSSLPEDDPEHWIKMGLNEIKFALLHEVQNQEDIHESRVTSGDALALADEPDRIRRGVAKTRDRAERRRRDPVNLKPLHRH